LAPRSPELRPYRLAVYGVFGLICAVLFLQLIRAVVGDLYGRDLYGRDLPVASAATTPAACLDDLDRLYQQLAARAIEPAPRNQGRLSAEWDLWSRRWETELDSVAHRCDLASPKDAVMGDLAEAVEALENLRRVLARSADESSAQAGRARDALASARAQLFHRPQ